MGLEDVRALTFDVFGTVTDWRASVIREGEELAARKGFETDWPSFADEWRFDGYIAGMLRVRDGELPWMPVDQLHRIKLDELLAERGIDGLTEEEVTDFNRVWHRLQPCRTCQGASIGCVPSTLSRRCLTATSRC